MALGTVDCSMCVGPVMTPVQTGTDQGWTVDGMVRAKVQTGSVG